MRIASKINVALFGAFACGTLAAFAVLESTIQPRFDELERAQAKLNHERVTGAFGTFTEKLQTAAQDYAFWDETYRFVQGEDVAAFVSSNLEPEFKAVDNLGINALVFLRADGAVQWGAAYDLETEESIEGLVEELAVLGRRDVIRSDATSEALRGLVNTSKGLMLVAIAPALKSDHSGPAVGKVISAMLLDVAAAKELTSVDFTIETLALPQAPAGLTELPTLEIQPERIQTASVINSAFGNPLAELKAFSPRDVSRTGSMAIRSAMFMMLLAGVLAIGVLWLFLRKEVVARLGTLKAHIATAGSSGKIQQTDVAARNDEIFELAQSFNSMAEQVNHLRDALADNAYQSGLSEWAAGTLHNVRNGLVPVGTATWQIERLWDESWVKNVANAVAQHADAATPEDRRTKLNEFLIGSAARFAEGAQRTTELTGTIKGASQSIVDIVSEFERYAHRKTEIEDVDLLPLLKSSAKSTVEVSRSNIEFVLPQKSFTVSGNSIILRQVVSNIFSNAIEAMEGQPRRGRIEVEIAAPEGGAGLMQIKISDNGEGLSADRLTAIFQRGVSTRDDRTGGLGLHWCANAVKLLGGTIRATSDGPGKGATFILELPANVAQINKVAA